MRVNFVKETRRDLEVLSRKQLRDFGPFVPRKNKARKSDVSEHFWMLVLRENSLRVLSACHLFDNFHCLSTCRDQ